MGQDRDIFQNHAASFSSTFFPNDWGGSITNIFMSAKGVP